MIGGQNAKWVGMFNGLCLGWGVKQQKYCFFAISITNELNYGLRIYFKIWLVNCSRTDRFNKIKITVVQKQDRYLYAHFTRHVKTK